METVLVDYSGDLHCSAQHVGSKAIIETDAPKDNKGKGEKFSPTDLVAAAIGTCICTVIGIYAQSKNIDLKGMRAEIRKEMTKNPPRMIATLEVEIWIPIEVSPEDRVKFEKIAQSCPVTASLHPSVALSVNFNWKS